MIAAARGYDKALCCAHVSLLLWRMKDKSRRFDPPALGVRTSSPRAPRYSTPRSLRCPQRSFRVGLRCRVGIDKGRDGHARLIDAHDTRISVERDVEGL